ncbi:hypothetical protein GCM10023330_21330 [Litoribaculum gwangyangense]|uniref:Uncharacterized protein n=1 Tax=Litoribaculum gwangyangense TaxID=1130722 RepID=A0ABP9CR36_9FLAO
MIGNTEIRNKIIRFIIIVLTIYILFDANMSQKKRLHDRLLKVERISVFKMRSTIFFETFDFLQSPIMTMIFGK